MPVTDALMAQGSFSIPLGPETPPEIRKIWEPSGNTDHFQTVVITPGRVLDSEQFTLTSTEHQTLLLDNSIFTGRVDYLVRGGPTDRFSISGPSILAWMGDGNGKGQPCNGSAFGGSTQLYNRMGNIFGVAASANAGFTTHANWTNNSIGVTVTDDVDLNASQRSNLDRLRVLGGGPGGAGSLQAEYYAAPSGDLYLFDSGDYSWFRGDSSYIVGPGLAHEERTNQSGAAPASYRVLPADVTVQEDWSDWSSRVNSHDAAGNTEQYARIGPRTFDGVNSVQSPSVWVSPIGGSVGGDEILNQATNLASTEYTAKYRYTISLDAQDALQFVRDVSAGSRIYVYDQNRFQTDDANPLMVNGHSIGCVLVRITAITYPLLPGMGIYVVKTSDGSLTGAELSQFIDYNSDPKRVTLQVGPRARTLTEVLRGN